ncbi:MAG TPA: alginate export family protein [Nitrosomonas sp.]|uniref:alginate export family protein n=1 Tax=Nitrosomonas sp. TaxID=42353 RepID=UPI000E94F89F|nr:alginate export family protein [Nitrosomonas sp.]HBV21200.1 hypothetical protein [Nitrosomonas sp.]HNP26609.1 alginate export family protein [Nitrosomonas sp.]
MRSKKLQRMYLMILFILGCTWINIAFAIEKETTENKRPKKSIVVKERTLLAATPPAVSASELHGAETAGFFLGDFDRLTRLMEEHKTPLAAMAPDWLNIAIEHRTRYETFDNGFTSAIPGDNEQIHQRTRFLFEIEKILDPLRFTLELTDMRAPMAHHGQDRSNVFANHFDFTQLHVDLVTNNFLGTGHAAQFEVGRMVLDFGEGRLVAGHRWGTLTPTFDGMQFRLGNDQAGWGLRVFGTRPVNREPTKLDWNTPETYFSGAQITNRNLAWANADLYWFQLNEGNKGRKREISTTGFRLFATPSKGKLDYEIESMYQFGAVDESNYFAHRHHGEIGYSFNTKWPTRLIYLFDYSSGNKDPRKNFDFLYAKRRVEFGPTGILGIFFPSNIFSPAGFRATVSPTPTLRFMVSHRAFWLADKNAAFVGSGLQDPTGQAGSFLGNLFDLNLRWDPQTSFLKRMSLDVGFTHLFKGSYFKRVAQSPGTQDTNFGYTMLTFKF